MTSGPFYFAWVDPTETVFDQNVHNRYDEIIFSYEMEQAEGQTATLALEIRNPHVGLLSAGRKQWAWFAKSTGSGSAITPIFFGRLVAVPNDMFNEVITIHFSGSPLDLTEAKRLLMPSLQVRPFWDPVFLEPARRMDPDAILEGHSALWHIDRITHELTVSDVITGEDGTVDFLPEEVFYDSVKMTIDKPPLKSVFVNSSVAWTQFATGVIDTGSKAIATVNAENMKSAWPKTLASLGGGWTVDYADAHQALTLNQNQSVNWSINWQNQQKTHQDGDTMSIQESYSGPNPSPLFIDRRTGAASIQGGQVVTYTRSLVIGDPQTGTPGSASIQLNGFVINNTTSNPLVTALFLRYEAKRERTENIRFTLSAGLQPVFTDPGGEAADFAQDSELISVQGKVGLEGPYGTYRGSYGGGQSYQKYDLFTVGQHSYQVTRDHVSQGSFDPECTAGVWVGGRYGAGENVFAGATYQVLISTTGGAGPPNALDPYTQQLIYGLLPDPHAGPRLYLEVPNFRGTWFPSTIYVSGEIIIAPGGKYYQVAVGHTSNATFDEWDSTDQGELFYSLLLNPPPIGDVARRSYFPTDRGLWSLEHLIARARAKLMIRSRAVKVSWDCHHDFALQLSCRKNALITDPRIPGGEAIGKVISYKLTGNGDTGEFLGHVEIGCCVGLGDAVTTSGGVPTYVDEGYVDPGYQVYTSSISAIPIAGDVGYSVPIDRVVDDGLTFPLTKSQAVNGESLVTMTDPGILTQLQAQQTLTQNASGYTSIDQIQSAYAKQTLQNSLKAIRTWYTISLKNVQNGPFDAEYDTQVGPMVLPKQIDLSSG